jgi:hypothetical protein
MGARPEVRSPRSVKVGPVASKTFYGHFINRINQIDPNAAPHLHISLLLFLQKHLWRTQEQ